MVRDLKKFVTHGLERWFTLTFRPEGPDGPDGPIKSKFVFRLRTYGL